MKTILKENQTIYIRSMGKALKASAIFTNDDDCNDWLEKNRDHGVIAVYGNVIFTANVYDKGVSIND